jgi:hypothetical protein
VVEIRKMRVKDLQTDTYQRLLGDARVTKFAKNFDERLVGFPLVNVRDNGEAYIVDGQHRVGAVSKNGIDQIECRVVYGLSKEEEAELFIKSNIDQKRLSGSDLFFASLDAGIQWAIDLQSLYGRFGYKLARRAKMNAFGDLVVSPSAAVVGSYRENPAAHSIALDIITTAWSSVGGGRNPEIAIGMGNARLITGTQACVQGYLDKEMWDGKTRLAASQVLGRGIPKDWISVSIPSSLDNLPNADRGSCATALAISLAIAKKLKKNSLVLAAEDVLTSASFRKGGYERAFTLNVGTMATAV